MIKFTLNSFLFTLCFGAVHAQYQTDKIQKVPFSRNNAGDELVDLHSGDFNKDGHIDVVADGGLFINQSGYIEHSSKPLFFINDGKGKLSPATSPFSHASTSAMISDFGDYNKDGFEDMLVFDFWANGLRVYTGGAGLSFTLTHTLSTGTHGSKAYFEDFDADGDLDIVNISSGSSAVIALHIFENSGSGFKKLSYSGTSKNFFPFLWAKDINKDGRMDFVSLGTSFSSVVEINIWIQKADKTFTLSPDESLHEKMKISNNSRFSYVWNDLNADGVDDLVFLNDIGEGYLKGYVNGAYSSTTVPYIGSRYDISSPLIKTVICAMNSKMIQGDVDNDGEMDLVAYSTEKKPDQTLVVINDPFNKKSNFMVQHLQMGTTKIKPGGQGLLLADLDHDDDLELISLGLDDTLRIFNNSTKSVPASISAINPSYPLFTLYPNPATTILNLSLNSLDGKNITNMLVYTAEGRLLKEVEPGKWKDGISIAELAAGNYLLSVKMNDGHTYSKLFCKE